MPDPESLLGRVIDGKYRLEAKLGQGGMGSVYRATHLGTDRMVALKLIAPDLTEQEDFVGRFRREARTAGRLRHPNIVDLTDFGFAEQPDRRTAYLVMELLEGETLAQVLLRNPRPPLSFVVDLVQQVCLALQEAHDHGVIHRDLKPDNLWLEPDRRGGHRVKILDFGLAKFHRPQDAGPDPGAAGDGGATEALRSGGTTPIRLERVRSPEETELGTVLGTPAYMSPEQCRGLPLDPRSDLYSLAVIAYQMLGGRMPFQGPSAELINAHIQSSPPSLRRLNKALPSGLAELVMECLSKDPADRPATAEILGNAFEAHAQSQARMLQQAIAILLERWDDIRPMLWPLFAPPVLLLVLLFAMARGWGTQMSESVRIFVPGTGTALAMALTAFGAGLLKGRLSPLVLHHLLFPMGPVDPSIHVLSRSQRRSYLRFVGLNALFLFSLFLLPEFIVWMGTLEAPAARRWLVGAGIGGGLLVLGWILGTRRYGGPSIGILPCVMFVEGLDPEAAGRRIVGMIATLRARHLDPRRVAREGPVGILAVVLTFLVLLVGKDALEAHLPPGPATSGFAYFLWFTIFLLAGWSLLATLDAILTALAYLRARKLARESLKEAFEGLRARHGQLEAGRNH